MSTVDVNVAGLTAYSAGAASVATDLAGAAATAGAAGAEVLAPFFGVIGGDFVAAYAKTFGGHVASIGQLSATVASLGTAAATTAAGYTGADVAHAAGIAGAAPEGVA